MQTLYSRDLAKTFQNLGANYVNSGDQGGLAGHVGAGKNMSFLSQLPELALKNASNTWGGVL